MRRCPVAERTAEEWGRVALGLPGFDWRSGMWVHALVEGDESWYRLDGEPDGLYKESDILVHESRIYDDTDDVSDLWPDPDDPATIGCLLALLGPEWSIRYDPDRPGPDRYTAYCPGVGRGDGSTRGRACIAAAEARGCWPGGTRG